MKLRALCSIIAGGDRRIATGTVFDASDFQLASHDVDVLIQRRFAVVVDEPAQAEEQPEIVAPKPKRSKAAAGKE